MRTSLTASALCLLAIAMLCLSGCGLKGDLYLPEPEPTQPVPAENEPNGDDEDENG